MDHVTEALAKLLYQYRDAENLRAVISALAQQSQDEEDTLQDILVKEPIAVAVGEQLDGWGKVLGVVRAAMSDEDYRRRLYLRKFMMFSEGTIEDLVTIFAGITGAESVQLIEYQPATISLQADVSTPPDTEDSRWAMELCKVAGVEIESLSYSEEPAFAFYEYESPEVDTLGFDDGTGTVGGTFSTAF